MNETTKTVRRDWLKRQVDAGKMEARTVFDIEHDGNGSNDVFGGAWMPARIRRPVFREHYPDQKNWPNWHYSVCDNPDFIEGNMNFYESDFRSASGFCYKSGDGIYMLHIHSNALFAFRERT